MAAPSSVCTLATCNLNQWALDFEGNLARVRKSIRIAKEKGATYRLGPELELCGYSCEDHFLEPDTYLHSWQALGELLKDDITDDIICDIGMPIMHKNVRYNCRIWLLNRKILMIRPKINLCNDGNYREMRYFMGWAEPRRVETYQLPAFIMDISGQKTVPIGDLCVQAKDACLGVESCEELFTANSPHIGLSLDGVEVFGNGSGSLHTLRKLHRRVDLMRFATSKVGGVYLYANQQGCDGNRLYFDGSAMIFLNGELLAQASQFSPTDVEVITANIDLDDIRAFRGSIISRSTQASRTTHVQRVEVDFHICHRGDKGLLLVPTPPREVKYLRPEEEIVWGPACWLWDYLRRTKVSGFFLALSGGADSASVAAIMGGMCQMLVRECARGNEQVKMDVAEAVNEDGYIPTDPRDLCSRIFFTCYMGTKNSSAETRSRAKRLAHQIGSTHLDVDIDDVCASMLDVFVKSTGKTPKFAVHGGSKIENLALQNIQARSRMVLSYVFSQLLRWSRGERRGLFVLSSGNVDEALRGYLTKYDCSSADLNPIGGVSKVDLRRFLKWAALDEGLGYSVLAEIESAPPTAELEPITREHTQTDEADMGMTYEELSTFGRLRKIEFCGPYNMFLNMNLFGFSNAF